MATPTIITSPPHLQHLLSTHKYLLVDFHATWCGPCHAISPIYNALSTQNAHPSTIAFTKVDVDAQQQIAREYGVSAMPTFLIFRDGKVVETIRGANPPALRSAVDKISRKVGEEKKKEEREKAREEVNEVSVSGSYGISKGSGWKMSLK